MEEERGSQGWWRGEGVSLLGDKKNRKCAAELIVVNSEETTEMSRYLNCTKSWILALYRPAR